MIIQRDDVTHEIITTAYDENHEIIFVKKDIDYD